MLLFYFGRRLMMGDRPKAICIIPVRAGSKSIKNKNLIALKGRTLVAIAAERAMRSKLFAKVVITTDYPRSKLGLDDVPRHLLTQLIYHKRNASLCTDDALMTDVIADAVKEHGGGCDTIWLTQVTCPFTNVEDMIQIDKMLKENDELNSVITFKLVKEHANRAYSIKKKDGYLEAFKFRYTNYKNRQDLFDQFIRSGNLYVVRKDAFEKMGTLECKPTGAYVVDRVTGMNIDEQEDVILVKYYLGTGGVRI